MSTGVIRYAEHEYDNPIPRVYEVIDFVDFICSYLVVKHHVLVDQGFRRTVRFIRPYGNLEAMRDKEKAYFNRKLSSGGYHNGEVAIFLDSHFCSGRQKPDRGFRTQIASKFFVKCNRRILKSVTTASYLLARPKMMIWLTKLHPQAKLHPHQEKKLRRMIPRNKAIILRAASVAMLNVTHVQLKY
ncbi:hypothetical protein Y032_0235g3177 [Ancylostoma ceylanicum]|uniref:Uncharacterized protein n=1 Tax=Ancylostoma ceylanicum TaxID=53326 RepID=A0A016SEZ2_9BILA|nr:hypothetical protein Y032_0235g3177 [Ancylostoma ceylanicum]